MHRLFVRTSLAAYVAALSSLTLASQAPEPHQEKTVSIFAQVRDAARRAADPLSFVETRGLIDAGPLTPGAVRHSFRAELPYCSDRRAEAIWKSLKLKAREPEHFVEVITSTTVTDESVLFGFIRVPVIEAPGKEPFTITEHVMLDGELKSVLFIQTDGDFLATNRVEKDGNDWYFVLHYVYDYPKSKEAFDEEMATVMYKLLAWADAEMKRSDESSGSLLGDSQIGKPLEVDIFERIDSPDDIAETCRIPIAISRPSNP